MWPSNPTQRRTNRRRKSSDRRRVRVDGGNPTEIFRMPIALSINGEIRRFDADTISVGRGSENVISLPHDERLAPLQAILKCVAGRWIVEAQGGGAVRVGDGRPAQFAWINPG